MGTLEIKQMFSPHHDRRGHPDFAKKKKKKEKKTTGGDRVKEGF